MSSILSHFGDYLSNFCSYNFGSVTRSEDESLSGMVVGVVRSACRVDLSHLDSGALQDPSNHFGCPVWLVDKPTEFGCESKQAEICRLVTSRTGPHVYVRSGSNRNTVHFLPFPKKRRLIKEHEARRRIKPKYAGL